MVPSPPCHTQGNRGLETQTAFHLHRSSALPLQTDSSTAAERQTACCSVRPRHLLPQGPWSQQGNMAEPQDCNTPPKEKSRWARGNRKELKTQNHAHPVQSQHYNWTKWQPFTLLRAKFEQLTQKKSVTGNFLI